MYAVIVRVKIDAGRGDEATKTLHEEVVPMAKSSPGFVRGLWLRSTDGQTGRGVVVFNNEENARAAAESAQAMATTGGRPVTFESTEVVEVVAEA
jgi:hypothetical protein